MKNSLINILLLITLVSCMRDNEDIVITPLPEEVPSSLLIDGNSGIKLESYIVLEEVRINIKLPADGYYRIKIRHGLSGKMVSQERLLGKRGDNLLKVYVRTLDVSSFKLVLATDDHIIIGASGFAKS